ncbi:hypothetical protein NL676_024684 [Syzygium grande]|nr:hypothetical protein NL676_024684 [Syzygium grande]
MRISLSNKKTNFEAVVKPDCERVESSRIILLRNKASTHDDHKKWSDRELRPDPPRHPAFLSAASIGPAINFTTSAYKAWKKHRHAMGPEALEPV